MIPDASTIIVLLGVLIILFMIIFVWDKGYYFFFGKKVKA